MHIHRLAALPLLAMLAVSAHADALSAPRPLAPRALGGAPVTQMTPRATDGTNILLFTRSSDSASDQAIVVAPDGTQLSTGVAIPGGHSGARWAGHYFVTSGRSYVRIDANGTLLDRTPLPMPQPATNVSFIASNGRRLLLHYVVLNQTYLLGPDGVAVSIGRLPDSIAAIAGNDGHFLISYRPSGAGSLRLRLLDERGQMVRDEAMDGIAPIQSSDGFTWLALTTNNATAHFLDNDFRPVATFHLGGMSLRAVMSGRGYLFSRIQRSLGTAGEEIFTELRAPSYATTGAFLPLQHRDDFGPSIWGNRETILLFGSQFFVDKARIGRIASIDQITKPYPLFTVTLPPERYARASATNAAGLTLLVWSESTEVLGRANLYASRVSANGELLDPAPLLLTNAECGSIRTSVTTDGTNFLVGWLGCFNIGADLITPGLAHTRSFRNVISASTTATVSVHFDGDSYLLHWYNANRTHLVEILANGTVAGPTTQHAPSFFTTYVAPRRGGGYLMLFHNGAERRVAPLSNRLRIDDDGVQIPLDPGSGIFSFHAAGDRFLLTARRENELRAMWLDASGRILGPIPTATTSLAGMSQPKILCDVTCMLLWTERPVSGTRILAKPIGTAANDAVTFGDPVLLATYPAGQAVGETILFRGTPDDPRLVITDAQDLELGGKQLFVHTPPRKHRAARH